MSEAASFSVLVGVCAVALAVVHLVSWRLRFRTIPRSYWLSGAGGVSVAYVFVHVLPELEASSSAVEQTAVGFLEHHVYLLALFGFALYYGVERLVQQSADNEARRESRGFGASGDFETSETSEGSAESERSTASGSVERDGRSRRDKSGTSSGVFWLHVGSFAAYNGIVGYLLVHRESPDRTSLLLFAFALGLHFVVNDHGLREHHHDAYDHVGRWVLAAGVLLGVVVGSTTMVGEPMVMALFAFLAGGIVLNVVKEELPEKRQSNFWAFGAGAAAYAALLLLV